MSELTCAKCNGPAERMDFTPSMSYETHITIQFWEHTSLDGSKPDVQVPMCRQCAIEIALAELQNCDISGMEFRP